MLLSALAMPPCRADRAATQRMATNPRISAYSASPWPHASLRPRCAERIARTYRRSNIDMRGVPSCVVTSRQRWGRALRRREAHGPGTALQLGGDGVEGAADAALQCGERGDAEHGDQRQ